MLSDVKSKLLRGKHVPGLCLSPVIVQQDLESDRRMIRCSTNVTLGKSLQENRENAKKNPILEKQKLVEEVPTGTDYCND